jgi:hypothetical protein
MNKTCSLSASGPHDAGHIGQGRRADIRAVCEAEKNKDELTPKICDRAWLAVVIRERKILAVVETRDVGIGKRRFRQRHIFLIAARQDQGTSQQTGQRIQQLAHGQKCR